jgi:tetratricopeptide (TPR) repeat protein
LFLNSITSPTVNFEKEQNITTKKSPNQAKLSITEALQQAIAHHKANQLQDAERLYRAILRTDPDHADANHNLGVLALKMGQTKAALPFLQKAIETNPRVAQFWISLVTAQINGHQANIARHTLATARQHGITGDAINELENYLSDLQSSKQSLSSPLMNKSAHFASGQRLDPPQGQINTITNLYYSGQMAKAEQACNHLLAQFPDSVILLNIWGAALRGLNKFHEAVSAFGKAIQLKPDYTEAYNNRGITFKDLGRHQEALNDFEMAIQLKPDYAEAYNNMGNALMDLGRHQEALDDHEKAIHLKPDYAEAYNNRGNALNDLGRHQEALNDYDKAILLKPDYAEAYNNRGNALNALGRHQEALGNYDKAIQLKPDYAEAYINRGNTLNDLGRHQKALNDYDKAIQIKPDYAEAYKDRGTILYSLGRHREASDDYEKAIQLKPDYAEAYRAVSELKKFKADDAQIGIMETLLEKNETNVSGQMHLCFALSKAYEDIFDYDKSFQYLKKGNELRKKELNYNIDIHRSIINQIKVFFNEKIETITQESDPVTPVFIVGMPRSGTTLVEQILASHTQVYGAGELTTIAKLGTNILSRYSNFSIVSDNTLSIQGELKQLHDEYLESLTALNVPESIITDKMPLNFLWIGFILTAFPKAKIIHLNRDSRATCWSIFKHFFSKGNGFAYDMVTLTDFYKLYLDLMAFWRKRFPNKIYDLCYEDLTENQEEETRRLLSYCDLSFENHCLYFHNTQRVVKTASAIQVRKEMYTGSSEAWRNYQKHIQPMIQLLSGI